MSFSNLNVTVTIGGVDVTSYVVPGSLKIRSVLTRRVDTCNLVLRDAAAVEPTEWDEIVITDGATRIFGGYVLSKAEGIGADVGIDYRVECGDYTVLLDKEVVKEEYEDQTDQAIIQDLFSTYLSEITTATNVEEIRTHTKVRFNRKTLREAVDMLADYAGADWYVDYDQDLHFFAVEDAGAPFALSDDPDYSTSFPHDALSKRTDGTKVVNRVEVVGGNYLSDDQVLIMQGTGQDERVSMPFKMREPEAGGGLKVYRNDGTEGTPVWTQLTVKVGYIDSLSGADEVLHYYQEKVLEIQSVWPDLTNAVKVEGRYEIPLRTRVRDDASRSFYGRWFDDVIVDPDITDKSTAKLAGKGLLAKNAMGAVAINCSCREPGIRSGMAVSIVDGVLGIDDEFLAHEVTTTIAENGRPYHNLSLGVADDDLIDIMVKLARSAKPKPLWREDEVLDELLEASEEIDMTEGATTVTDRDPSTDPYLWKTSIGAVGSFEWGYFSWRT